MELAHGMGVLACDMGEGYARSVATTTCVGCRTGKVVTEQKVAWTATAARQHTFGGRACGGATAYRRKRPRADGEGVVARRLITAGVGS